MAVTQAFFDPTEPYVAGSVFINTLSSFTNRRFAMNQQLLERLAGLPPKTLTKMRSDIQARIDKLERQKESEYDIEKVIADETTRYKMSAATDKRAADRVASSKEKAATKALIVSKKKIDDAMDDAFAVSNIEDIAKQIADTTGIGAFRDVIDAKGLQTTLRDAFPDPAAREEKLKTAMKSLYGVPSEEGYDKVTTFSDVEEMSDIDFEKFYDAFKGVYGLNPESASRRLDDPSFVAYEEIKKETKDKAEKKFEGSSGTGVFIDTSFDAARKKAEINRAKQRQAAEAKNKQIQDQIDALEMQKIGLSEQLEKALSGDTSDIYGGLAELGIRNLRLGSPFQQAGAIQRREPIERSRDIDLDIAGMIPRPEIEMRRPEIEIPRPEIEMRRPEIEIPKRKDTDELEDDFDFEFAPAEIDFIPTEKPEEPPPVENLDPLIRGRFKRDPLEGFYDDQGRVVDESMRPPVMDRIRGVFSGKKDKEEKEPEVTTSDRMALIGEILWLNEKRGNPEFSSEQIQAMVNKMSMPVLSAYYSNMAREVEDRRAEMAGGGGLPITTSGLGTTEEIPVSPVDADILDAMPEGKKLIANTKIKSAYEKQLKTGEPVMMLNDFEVYITIGENGRPQFRLVAPDGTEQIVDQMRDFNRYNIIEAQLSK